MTDECTEAESCVFDPDCEFYFGCWGAAAKEHEKGECGDRNPMCPLCIDQLEGKL